MVRSSRKKRSERGEAEMGFFMVVLVIAGIISAALAILHWVKQTKDDRVERRWKITRVDSKVKRQPGMYVAVCDRPLWKILSGTMQCSIDPDSYVEKELEYFR